MTVTTTAFGRTRDGAAVPAYRLENAAGASVTVLDYGATIQSLSVPNAAGGFTDVVLGYDTVTEYEDNGGFLGRGEDGWLYFSRWFEEPDGSDYREEVVVRRYPAGEVLEVIPGTLWEMPDGQRWVLQ